MSRDELLAAVRAEIEAMDDRQLARFLPVAQIYREDVTYAGIISHQARKLKAERTN